MFSKACEHGIRAVIYIATQSMKGRRVKIGDVAEKTNSPEAFTGKILGALSRYDIIKSSTGPNGGFEIDPIKMKEVKISDIVFALDGDSVYNGCALGLKECNNEAPCPMHDNFAEIRGNLKKMLKTTSVYDLANKLQSGKTTLVR